MPADLLKHSRLHEVVCWPKLALLVAQLRCDVEVLGFDRPLLGLANLLDPRRPSLLGGPDLSAERFDFASELVGIDTELTATGLSGAPRLRNQRDRISTDSL